MKRLHGEKVTAVQRDDKVGVEPLGDSNNGSIRSAQRKVSILLHELSHTAPIVTMRQLHLESLEPPNEACFSLGAQPVAHQVGNLRDNQRRDDQVEIPTLKYC